MSDLAFTLLFHMHHESEEERSSAQAYAEVVRLIRQADALPLSIAWLAEHHLSPLRGRLPAPLLLAVAAARETQRIRLGPCVLLLPLHHPLDLAEQVATADLLSDGRLVAGFGSGGNPDEFTPFGVPMDERRSRFSEGVDVVAQALRGEPFSFSGQHYTIPTVCLTPRPLQSVDRLLWVAAGSLTSAELAGRHGGNLLLARGTALDDLHRQIVAYRRGREAAGYDPRQGAVQVTRGLYIAENEATAWSEAEEGIRRHDARLTRYVDKAVSLREMARRSDFIIGTPAQCVQEIRALRAALPLTHLACDISLIGMPHDRVSRSLDRLGREVIPALHTSTVSLD